MNLIRNSSFERATVERRSSDKDIVLFALARFFIYENRRAVVLFKELAKIRCRAKGKKLRNFVYRFFGCFRNDIAHNTQLFVQDILLRRNSVIPHEQSAKMRGGKVWYGAKISDGYLFVIVRVYVFHRGAKSGWAWVALALFEGCAGKTVYYTKR